MPQFYYDKVKRKIQVAPFGLSNTDKGVDYKIVSISAAIY